MHLATSAPGPLDPVDLYSPRTVEAEPSYTTVPCRVGEALMPRLVDQRSRGARGVDGDSGFFGGFGEAVVVGEQGGEFWAEQAGGGQVDRVEGTQ
jgi:hypothetical protein